MDAELEPNSKKPRLEASSVVNSGAVDDEGTPENGQDTSLFPFQQFKVHRVLFTDPRSKSMCVLGGLSDSSKQKESQGIVIAEKQPLTDSSIPYIFSSSSVSEKKFQNDVYSQYVLNCREGGLGEMRVTTVYPATEAHARKYEAQSCRIVKETPEIYQKIVKPYAEKQSLSLEWVYNILEGKSEVDRVIYQDADSEVGFVLVPDLKWDQKELENLYVLAIARKRGILSMREIREKHLPMLRNMLDKGKKEICAKYNVQADQLRAYVHYQPSYYHFHIHFTHLRFTAPRSTVGDAHLLEGIIDNVANIDPMFYSKRTLSFVVKESSPLWAEYCRQ